MPANFDFSLFVFSSSFFSMPTWCARLAIVIFSPALSALHVAQSPLLPVSQPRILVQTITNPTYRWFDWYHFCYLLCLFFSLVLFCYWYSHENMLFLCLLFFFLVFRQIFTHLCSKNRILRTHTAPISYVHIEFFFILEWMNAKWCETIYWQPHRVISVVWISIYQSSEILFFRDGPSDRIFSNGKCCVCTDFSIISVVDFNFCLAFAENWITQVPCANSREY